ncbi:MAG: ABC transporter substrate-binding protein [Oscillospiraceae bacterium]|nr:ABC transporter substrate-binding protein [Oscillospiraceae bacterium]
MKRLTVLLLALALLCGCGAQTAPPSEPAPAEEPSAPQEQPAPVQTGAFCLAFEEDAGWDPYSCRSACNRLVLQLVYEPLFTVTANGTVDPVLATGWSVSEDGLVTTVTLRSGVMFHSGAEMTATDVVRSVRLARDGSYYSGRFDLLLDASAVDDTTVRFTTSKPYECFPLLLDIPVAGHSALSKTADGTGAYRLQEGSLRRFAEWHGGGDDLPRSVVLTAASSGETLRDAFQFGGVSVTEIDPNGDLPLRFGGDYEIWDEPTSALQFIAFRMDGLFGDGGLRAAVTCAIDRDAVVTGDMSGYGVATALLARPGTPWYSGTLAETVTYDPSRLRLLMPTGASAVMLVCADNPQRCASARRVADALHDCGLQVELKELGAHEFVEALSDGEYDLYYGEMRLSPDYDFAPLLRAAAGALYEAGSLEALCDLTRENSGNAYDLQKAVLTDGLLCPVAYKTNAVFGKRTLPFAIAPHLNGWVFPTE